VAESRVIYHIFQEGLSCIGNSLQEGALQTSNKDFQSIYSNSQTCCNVVESNLSESGLWGHFVVDRWDLKYVTIYPVCLWEFPLSLATVHLMHSRYDSV
jgi:hypothetical protein